jgi:hypothetical protein
MFVSLLGYPKCNADQFLPPFSFARCRLRQLDIQTAWMRWFSRSFRLQTDSRALIPLDHGPGRSSARDEQEPGLLRAVLR